MQCLHGFLPGALVFFHMLQSSLKALTCTGQFLDCWKINWEGCVTKVICVKNDAMLMI